MSGKIEIIKADADCRVEIARFLGDPLQSRHDYDVFSCPFHAEKTPGAFHVWRDGYHCFSCGAHGDIFDAWQFFTNRTLSELIKEHGDIDDEEFKTKRAEIAARTREARLAVDAERQRQLEKLHASERHIYYSEMLRKSLLGQAQWLARGIPEEWQAFFELGYAENFSYMGKSGKEISSSLVIPVKKVGGEVVTIRHRLLDAPDGSRYRPEMKGLGAHPFICNTDATRSDDLIIVEGEIKAMVTYLTYDKPGAQVVGIPSKSMMISTIKSLQGRNAVVIPDPDGIGDILQVAGSVGAHVLRLPAKIDDFILAEGLSKNWMRKVVGQARVG